MLSSTSSLVLLSQLGSPTKLLVNRLAIFLGRRSFSLYLLHPLVIVATMPLVQALSVAHGPKVAAVGGFVIVVLAVAAAASITYPLIEAPFINLGRGRRSYAKEPDRPCPLASPKADGPLVATGVAFQPAARRH
jgi:peptidoglycan/LPS O-acetylase OafA/YrhL